MRARASGRGRIDLVAAVGGLVVFAACATVASRGTVGPAERAAFEAINGLPASLEPFASAAQLAGTLVVGPLVALVALAFGRIRLSIAALLVTAGKLLVERVVWEVVVRERPGTTQLHAIVRGDVPTEGPSFVSGHVLLTTALAWVLMRSLSGRWRLVPWAVVAIVAFARVYLGAHNPLDVVGGAGLGVCLGAVVDLALPPPIRRPSLRHADATVGADASDEGRSRRV